MNSPIYFESLDNMSKTFVYLGNLNLAPLVKVLKDEYHKTVKNYGARTSVAILKAYYNEATRYSIGLPVANLTPMWFKRDKSSKLPKFVHKHFGKSLRSGSKLERLAALSLLRCYESITLKPVEDLSSIIEPSKGKDAFQKMKPSFTHFLERSHFCKTIKRKYGKELATLQDKKKVEGRSLHFSGKSGISGPTVLTACYQSQAITGEVREVMLKLDRKFGTQTTEIYDQNRSYVDAGGKDFSYPKSNKEELKTLLGRVTFVPDKGGKTRLVAIGNYWIQQTLIPIHELFYSILETIEEDGTYKQEDSFKAVLIASKSQPVWCYDLSKATDRFPLEPQAAVMSHLDPKLEVEWSKLLSLLQFKSPIGLIQYRVGQPMGLYSSWAVFALTHHFVIQYCAFLEGFKIFKDYRVLGDDVAIWNRKVAERYEKFIRKMDVDISYAKSIIPERSQTGPSNAEFAKRLSLYGEEFTPVSPELSRTAWKNLGEFPLFLTWLDSRGYDLKQIPVSKLMATGRFSIYEQKLIVVILFFWGLIRDPVWDLTDYQSFQLENVKYEIYFLRRNRMEEQDDAILEASDDIRADIEKVSRDLSSLPDGFAMEVILQTRLREVRELQKRVNDRDTPGHPTFKMTPGLNELEFMPDVSVENILSGLFKKNSKRQALGQYLKRIAKTALKEVNFTKLI